MSQPLMSPKQARENYQTERDALADEFEQQHGHVYRAAQFELQQIGGMWREARTRARQRYFSADDGELAAGDAEQYRAALAEIDEHSTAARAHAIEAWRGRVGELARWHAAALDAAKEVYRLMGGGLPAP